MESILITEDYNFSVVQNLSSYTKTALYKLWNDEYPMQLTYKSEEEFDTYLNNQQHKEHIIATTHAHKVVGWFFRFERENTQWFAMIIHNEFQGEKIGSTLLKLGKERYGSLNGWVIDHDRYYKLNGEKYRSPLTFYLTNACRVQYDDRLEVPMLSAIKIKL